MADELKCIMEIANKLMNDAQARIRGHELNATNALHYAAIASAEVTTYERVIDEVKGLIKQRPEVAAPAIVYERKSND